MTPSLQPLLDPEVAGPVAAWIATYLVHSTALVALAWVCSRIWNHVAVREQLWRAALIGPLVTASLQIGAGVDPLAGTWRMPTAEAEAEVAAAAPVPAQATDLRRSVRARVSTEERSLRRRPARTAAAPAVPAPSEPEPKGSGLDLAASLLLAAGIASLTWCALVEAARVARLGRRSPLEDPALRAEFERLKDRAGIRRRVRLERTARGLSPYATGVLFPRVVVPDPVRAGLDPRARRAMLAHELGHVARFDAAWSAVARTLGALLFFQPLNQLVLARLDENAEFACDAFAVRLTGDEVGLANCLTTVAGWILGEPAAAAPACPMAHRRSKLGERVEHILEVDGTRTPRRLRGLGLVAVALTAAAAPAVAARSDAEEPEASTPVALALTLEAAARPSAPTEALLGVFAALGSEARSLQETAAALRPSALDRPELLARLDAFIARAGRIAELTERLTRASR